MKRMKLVTIALLGAALTSASAFANCDPSLYVGGEAQYNSFKYDEDLSDLSIKKGVPGAGLFVGSRLHENFGVEAGVSTSKSEKVSWNQSVTAPGVAASSSGNLKLRHSNVYADILGYLPVASNVDLIGSLGVGLLSTKVNFNERAGVNILGLTAQETASVSGRHSKAGVRAGAGVQYKFDDNLGARLMVRFQKGNEIVKNTTQAGLGLFYQF